MSSREEFRLRRAHRRFAIDRFKLEDCRTLAIHRRGRSDLTINGEAAVGRQFRPLPAPRRLRYLKRRERLRNASQTSEEA